MYNLVMNMINGAEYLLIPGFIALCMLLLGYCSLSLQLAEAEADRDRFSKRIGH